MTVRAVAFLCEVLQTVFVQRHTVGTVCEDGRCAGFGRVHIADRTGLGLPESRKDEFPGAGGRGSQAGGKSQLVWDTKSQTGEHFVLMPWNVPDHKDVATAVALAQPHALFLFDGGSFQLAAFVTIAAAQAYVLQSFVSLRWACVTIGGECASPVKVH